MKTLTVKTALAAGLLSLALGCSTGEVATGGEPLASVTCDAGYVAFNFTRFPSPRSSEALSQATDAGLAAPSVPPPNVVRINTATCNGNVSWAELFQDACDGRTECAFQRTDCRGPIATNLEGAVRVTYSCSATPNETKSLVCNPPLKNCIFQLACTQPPPLPIPAIQPRVECVPENCNGATRRDSNMQCVTDLARPVEYSWGWNEALGQPERMSVYINSSDVKAVYPSIRTFRGTSQLDLDTTNIPYFKYPGSGPYFDRLRQEGLPAHRIWLAETLYDVKATVTYVVKPGTENKGMKGTLALWISDDYQVGTTQESAFRCLAHTVDMSKYGPGTRFSADRNLYVITLNERFVLPKDCREGGSMYSESQGILFRPRGWSAVDYANRSTHVRGQLNASYDLDGRTILLDDFTEETKKITCAPNPMDIFFNERASTHDRYRYYAQRQITLNYESRATGYWQEVEKIESKYGRKAIYVQEANLTTLGLSSIRPKALEYKVRTVGPARGFLRVDTDWYLSGDRHNYWLNTGLRDYPLTLQTWLVPLDANDAPLPESSHLNLGEARVFRSTAYGQTIAAKYAITEELRQKFMTRNGTFEATKAGRKFKFRTCLKLGDGSRDFLEPPQYTIQINAPDKCRVTEAPFLIKTDPSVAPLEPLSSDGLAESNPASTGDGRMSQKQENDQDQECTRMGGQEVCRTSGAADGEGEGSFGGSVLATDNSGYAGAGKVRVNREAELAGFQVLDDPEEKPFSTPGTKVAFNISPDWDAIAGLLGRTVPGPRFEGKNVSVGVKGLSMGVEFKVPVRYGVLQGTIVYGASIGVGLGVTFEYEYVASRPASCAGDECETIYTLTPAGSLSSAARGCYQSGGRLADLRTAEESGFLRGKIPQGGEVWLGAQVANEFSPTACYAAWFQGLCAQNHVTTLRWLADDEDFASVRGSGAFTLDTNHITVPASGFSVQGLSAARPGNYGVTLSSAGVMGTRPMSDALPAVCKLRNTATVTSHIGKASLDVVGAAGFSLAFCSPSDEIGVCLEGSFNILEAKLTPSVTYTHHDLTDAAGRKGTQSNIKLSLDFEMHVLSGSLDLKIKLGPWFSFSYNLFSFSGLKLPASGNLAEKEFPQKEDFQ